MKYIFFGGCSIYSIKDNVPWCGNLDLCSFAIKPHPLRYSCGPTPTWRLKYLPKKERLAKLSE